MKDIRVENQDGQTAIDLIPQVNGERALALCNRRVLTGSLVQIRQVAESIGEELDGGNTEALDECLRIDPESGRHQIISGEGYLGQIDGREPDEFEEISHGIFYETLPESKT